MRGTQWDLSTRCAGVPVQRGEGIQIPHRGGAARVRGKAPGEIKLKQTWAMIVFGYWR
jgi:hypothetical protein